MTQRTRGRGNENADTSFNQIKKQGIKSKQHSNLNTTIVEDQRRKQKFRPKSTYH